MSKVIDKIIFEELTKVKKENQDCNCGCGGCGGSKTKSPILKESKVSSLLSEGLKYHIDNKIPLFECEYRIGSEAHLSLIREARKLYSRGIIEVSEADKNLLETNLGHFGEYKGELVPLDLPMLNEGYSTLELYKIKDKLKNQGFEVSIKPAKFDKGMYNVTYKSGDIDDLESALNKIFGDDYRIVFDENLSESKVLEAEYQGKEVQLNKPKRGGSKAYYVYVKDPKTKKVKKVSFGSGGLKAKISNKEARKNFASRHNCKDKKDRTKAGYWSCRLPHYAKQLGMGANMNTFW